MDCSLTDSSPPTPQVCAYLGVPVPPDPSPAAPAPEAEPPVRRADHRLQLDEEDSDDSPMAKPAGKRISRTALNDYDGPTPIGRLSEIEAAAESGLLKRAQRLKGGSVGTGGGRPSITGSDGGFSSAPTPQQQPRPSSAAPAASSLASRGSRAAPTATVTTTTAAAAAPPPAPRSAAGSLPDDDDDDDDGLPRRSRRLSGSAASIATKLVRLSMMMRLIVTDCA